MDSGTYPVIRAANVSDGPAISAVLENSYPQLMATAYEPDVLAMALPGMTKANPTLLASGTYYVAEISEHGIVACGGWTHEKPGTRDIQQDIAHIRHFATHRDWIGKGFGRQLFDRCRRDALRANVSTFTCFSTLNGESFYRALGFVVEARTEVVLGNGARCPSVVMARRIDG